jgi:hypothetical protein
MPIYSGLALIVIADTSPDPSRDLVEPFAARVPLSSFST